MQEQGAERSRNVGRKGSQCAPTLFPSETEHLLHFVIFCLLVYCLLLPPALGFNPGYTLEPPIEL